MNRSEQIGELMSALAKAQAEMTFASKDSTNPAFSSKYADLASVIAAVRPALSKHGIAFMQFDESDVERQTASVTTSLHHGEQWISITAEAPAVGLKGFNVQSIGSCWTYLRRYTLQAFTGLASDDDDGNSLAVQNAPVSRKAKPEPKHDPASAPTGIRSSFFSKAKELGWGLGDIKHYLTKLFGEASTAKLSEQQLADTLEAFSNMTPTLFAASEAFGTTFPPADEVPDAK